jgi:hypothetical protein
MNEKEVTIKFDLNNEIDKRVYSAIRKLPAYFGETDVSKALIHFINDLAYSLAKSDKRNESYKSSLRKLIARGKNYGINKLN